MADFRFQGVVPSGKIVQGTITASNAAEAKKKIQELSKGRSFRLDKLEKRLMFVYKARKGEKIIEGEQKAYSKAEVENALTSMGYKVVYVRKKLAMSLGSPPVADVITFVRLSADLLREKLPFNEVLNLLSNDIDNKALRETLKDINADLRKGAESERVFMKFLERRLEFKKSMKSAMLMPMITLVLLILATIFYVAYIFPETARMFLKYGIELPPMTEATLEFSDWLVANILYFVVLMIGMGVGVFFLLTNKKSRLWVDKISFRLPVMGGLIHKTAIEVFCRVFYSLYSGSGENIDVIKTAAEATGNSYFTNQIRTITIPMMLKHGKGLHESFEASEVFTKTALSRFHAGAETGMVRETALQLANYYERETTYKLKSVVDFMQLWVALIIMIVMTAITIVSSETAVIKPNSAPGISEIMPTLLIVSHPIRNILKRAYHGCRSFIAGKKDR